MLVAAPPVARRKRTGSWRCFHHFLCPNCRQCLHHQRRDLTKGDEEDTPGGDDVLLRGVREEARKRINMIEAASKRKCSTGREREREICGLQDARLLSRKLS